MTDELLDRARRYAEGGRVYIRSGEVAALVARCETGRQWETIARQLAPLLNDRRRHTLIQDSERKLSRYVPDDPKADEALAAFRALADGATEEDE